VGFTKTLMKNSLDKIMEGIIDKISGDNKR
jgi:hypothetical protein